MCDTINLCEIQTISLSYMINALMIYTNMQSAFWSLWRGRDRMVVGYTTTCVISAYQHSSCEFEPRSWQHYVIKFVSDRSVVFLWLIRFPPQIKLTARYNWNIVESRVKHHKPKRNHLFGPMLSFCLDFKIIMY